MKTEVYITKNKIWARELSFDWDGVSFDEVFGKIKKELRVNEFRVVLGNDVSFVTAVKTEGVFLTRESVLKLVKSWMPFEIDSDCFDWKEVVLAPGDVWVQIVAIEKELLLSLSSAVKKHGIKVELVTAIGILLGESTTGREVPVIIKWNGRERISVLAVNGLVDLVTAEISEEDLMVYATQKWNLAVNPEEIFVSESDFDLTKNVFSEKNKGEDKQVLNLPILKDIATGIKPEFEIEEENTSRPKPKLKSKLWMYLLILLVVAGTGVALLKTGTLKPLFLGSTKSKVVSPTPTPTLVVTPEPTTVDLTSFKLQVLNGGGVIGEAAKIKKVLLSKGFVNVDTGNTTATTEGVIKSKINVPESVIKMAQDSVVDYRLASPSDLKADSKYDLIVVVGSKKTL